MCRIVMACDGVGSEWGLHASVFQQGRGTLLTLYGELSSLYILHAIILYNKDRCRVAPVVTFNPPSNRCSKDSVN